MKKYVVWMMVFALLLCTACQKQPETPATPEVPQQPPQQEQPVAPETPEVPETPVTPENPAIPETPVVPETPAAPETPETPQKVEPEGAVSAVLLPGDVHGMDGFGEMVPLTGNACALLATSGGQRQIVIYDMAEAAVLSRLDVPDYQTSGVQQLSLLDSDSRTLLYFDGRAYWKVTADGDWQLTAEDYDMLQQSAKMGDHTVEQTRDGIVVDGTVPALLKNSNTAAYSVLRILDDHRLLYQRTGTSAMDSYTGVYDHNAGAVHPVTTANQRVLGIWGDSLILVRGGGPMYLEGHIDLTDYSYTPLEIRHAMGDVLLNSVLCNTSGTRLMASSVDGGGTHVQVFDLENWTELYSWTAPDQSGWNFYPMDENGLLVQQVAEGGAAYWKVEY